MLFHDDDRAPKIIDRRIDPRAGYRAVHLEVRRDDILLELQVRTELQHRWAEMFERAVDRLGRGLRYGESVRYDPAPERGETIVVLLHTLSAVIAFHEQRNETHESDGYRTIIDSLDNIAERLEQLP